MGPKYNKGATAEVGLREPYLLQQLQRAHHWTEDALSQWTTLDMDKLLSNCAELHQDAYPAVNAIIKSLEDLLSIVQRSRQELMDQSASLIVPSSNSITANKVGPQNYESVVIESLRSHFQPPLPSDMVMEFSLDSRARMQISVYGLTFTTNPAQVRKHVQEVLNFTLMGTETPSTQTFIITNPKTRQEEGYMSAMATSMFNLSYAQYILYKLNQAMTRCTQLRDKLCVHRRYL